MTDTEPETLELPEPIQRMSRRNQRLIVGLCATLAVAIAAVLIALAYKHSNDALRKSHDALAGQVQVAHQGLALASCVNNILGQRGPLTTADTNAEIDIFTRMIGVLIAPKEQQPSLYSAFLQHATEDIKTLQRDKLFRQQNPLGEC